MVFVVGANAGRRRLLAQALAQRLGVSAVSMGSGETTLAWARAARPAVVVTDLRMPGMDGYTLTRRIKSQPDTRTTRVVLVSSEGPDGHDRAREAGCTGFVTETASQAELAQIVQECLHVDERQSSRADSAA
jgi:CheY-like chemotaxis protein